MKGLKEKLVHLAGKVLLSSIVDVLCKTLRIEYKNYTQVEKLKLDDQKFIAAFWHGTMLVPWYLFREFNMTALVSKSKDGELLSRVLNKWNYKVVRGSSRDGGKEAFNTMVEKAKANQPICITPDGPTGPPFKMKAGTVVAAKRSGLPIVLTGVYYTKSIRLNSWDKFEIPKPFSRVKFVFSEPIYIDSDLEREEVSRTITDCENRLNNLQKEAERID